MTYEWFPLRVARGVTADARKGGPAIPGHAKEWTSMNPVEYKPARRHRLREILVDVAAGVVTQVVVTALVAAARLLF